MGFMIKASIISDLIYISAIRFLQFEIYIYTTFVMEFVLSFMKQLKTHDFEIISRPPLG